MAAATATEDSTALDIATARAIRDLVEASPFNASDWLLHELTQFNVKVNRTSFPSESREVIFTTLDTILKLAMTLPQQDPLAFSAYSAFALFPRMTFRSLPRGCKGRFAAGEIAKRCEKFDEGMIA
jgi:hypothetical protein